MRTHRRYALLTACSSREAVADLFFAEHLAVVRLEPVWHNLGSLALADFIFTRGDRIAFVPAVEIEQAMLDQRESSPFIWPAVLMGGIDHERAARVEDAILPWLESRTLGVALNEECVANLAGAEFERTLERARAYAFAGAASFRDVLYAIAPYAYALRFAANARAGARDERAGSGAMLLSRHARSVRADLGSEPANALARRWFDSGIFEAGPQDVDLAVADGAAAPFSIDLGARSGTIVHAGAAVPAGVLMRFDTVESPAVRSFGVSYARERVLRAQRGSAARVVGGSAGRILMLLREDFERVRDSDTDQAVALAERLRGEGIHVELRPAPAAEPESFDLIHAWGTLHARHLLAPLERARAAGKPVVLTPMLGQVQGEPAWGAAMTVQILRAARDETILTDHLALLTARRLDTGTITLQQEIYAGHGEDVRRVLGFADAVLVYSAEEESAARVRGCAAPVIRTAPLLAQGSAAIGGLAGTGDFVFSHAPLEPRCNQLALARAAAASGVRILFAGADGDSGYARAVRSFAAETAIFCGEVSPQEAAALYRSARVFADVAWFRTGASRIASAAAGGCSLVLSPGGFEEGFETAWRADPADEGAIGLALRDAWMHALASRPAIEAQAERVWERTRALDPLVAAAQAYAKASPTPSGAA